MKKWLVAAIVVLIVVSVASATAYFVKASDLTSAQATIADLQTQEHMLEIEVASLRATKTSLEMRIAEINVTLADTQKTLASTTQQLSSSETNVASLQGSLNTAQSNFQSAAKELSDLKSFYDGIFKGQAPPYRKPNGQLMAVVENTAATDVAWQQLVNFLKADPTDRNQYVVGQYVCSNFAEDVHNHAEAVGIRCSIVGLNFADSNVGHALVAFNTTDKGLVFIDCTGVKDYSTKSWDRVAFILI